MKNLESRAYSVERIADSKTYLYAKRYTLNAKIFLFLIFAFFFLNFNCFAQPVSSTELINNAKQYDGKVVVYEGEVIGEVMERGEFAWINIKDTSSAIGVWINKSLDEQISYTGSYKSQGDWLQVTGVFRRACAQHGGDLDIHAQLMRKLMPGRPLREKLNLGKRNLALMLLAWLCLILILRQFKRV